MKKFKVISILSIALLLLTTRVYAADNFSTTIKAEAQAKREETITVTFGLKDIAIESGEKGICAYTATLQFDPNVFEYVSSTGTDKWEAPFYQEGRMVGETKNAEVEKTAQDIGSITLRVKKDAKLGESTITLANFVGTTMGPEVPASNVSVKVNIQNKDGGSGSGSGNDGQNNNGSQDNNNDNHNNNDNNNGGNNTNQNNVNNNIVVNSNTVNNGNTNTNNNIIVTPNTNTQKPSNTIEDGSKKERLPQTGSSNVVVITLIGISITLAIVFLVKTIKTK